MAYADRPSHSVAGSGGPAGCVRIGVITGIHGLRGALRVRPDNPASGALRAGLRVHIVLAGDETEYTVKAVAALGRGTLKVTFAEINDPEAAQTLRGGILMINTADLPAPAPGEFYYFQALGCAVVTTDGRQLGHVEEIFENGANDVMVVRGGKTEHLIPVIADVVRAMDFSTRQITIAPIPGLLD